MESEKVKRKKFSYFIGIDVSKNEMDYAVMHHKTLLFHHECRNNAEDATAFIARLKEIPGFRLSKAIFCMENTGIYCNILLQVLKKLKAYVAVEHPLHIKRSLGLVREKTDKSDAIRIAAYAQKNTDQLRLSPEKRLVMIKLAFLSTLRVRLLTTSLVLTNPVEELKPFALKSILADMSALCNGSILAVKGDFEVVEQKMKTLIDTDERLRALSELICSVPGVGFVTATQIILSTNEFRDISEAKKFAAYAGVAPYKRESGKMFRRTRVSTDGNRRMKTLLHMSAVAAIRWDKEIKEYYHRKFNEEGKPKMLVINAVRSKLISRVFACVRNNRHYEKNYIHPEKQRRANQNDIKASDLIYH